jgi:hypothetical protein
LISHEDHPPHIQPMGSFNPSKHSETGKTSKSLLFLISNGHLPYEPRAIPFCIA